MDPPIPPKSPVLECILQDPPKHEDAEKGQISVDKSGEHENEEIENEEEEKIQELESSFAPTTTTPIPTSASSPPPTSTFTPARTSTPTSTPSPTPAPTPSPIQAPTEALTSSSPPAHIPEKVTRLEQVRQGIVRPQVGFWSTKNFLKQSNQTFFVSCSWH